MKRLIALFLMLLLIMDAAAYPMLSVFAKQPEYAADRVCSDDGLEEETFEASMDASADADIFSVPEGPGNEKTDEEADAEDTRSDAYGTETGEAFDAEASEDGAEEESELIQKPAEAVNDKQFDEDNFQESGGTDPVSEPGDGTDPASGSGETAVVEPEKTQEDTGSDRRTSLSEEEVADETETESDASGSVESVLTGKEESAASESEESVYEGMDDRSVSDNTEPASADTSGLDAPQKAPEQEEILPGEEGMLAGSKEDAAVWGEFYYEVEDGTVHILGRVPDIYYKENGEYDHEDNLAATQIAIPASIEGMPVTSVEGFYDCMHLKSLSLPEGLETIGRVAFSGCRDLTQVKIPSTVTEIGAGAFEGTGLKDVTIPAGTRTHPYTGDNPAYPGVFADCENLTSITFEEGMEDITRGWCSQCTGLREIHFPSTVKTIGSQAFEACSNLMEVTVPEGITFIDSFAFADCEKLSKVLLPSTLETVEDGAFMNTAISSITIPAGANSGEFTAFYRNLPYRPGIFEGCAQLTEARFEEGMEIVTRGWFFRCPGLEKVSLPSTIKEIGFRAFGDCKNLKEIHFPEGMEYIDNEAFIGCKGLSSIRLPSSLQIVSDGAFAETGLTEVVIPVGAETENRGHKTGVFGYCNSLRTIRFEEGIERITQGWCLNCSGLETIQFPSTLKEIFASFEYCDNLREVTLPEGLISVDNHSFHGCTSLTTVKFPSTLEEVGIEAFADCTSLTSVELGDNVTQIWDNAFSGCKSLRLFKVGSGLKYLKEEALGCCPSLKTVYLPEALELIEEGVFYECTSLTDVYYGGSQSSWNKIEIQKDNDPLLSAKLHPAKVSYKVTFNANGGTIRSGKNKVKTLTKTYAKGKALGDLPTPARTTAKVNYFFLGWYTSKVGGKKISKNTRVSKMTTYYAHWAKAEIGDTKITVQNCTWNGKKQTPRVIVKLSGVTLKENTHYTVSGDKNKIEPGTYKLTIKGKGLFAKSAKKKTISYKILKAEQTISIAKADKLIIKKASQKKDTVLLKASCKTATLTFTSGNEKILKKKKGKKNEFSFLKAGAVKVTVKAPASKHYKEKKATITVVLQDQQTIDLTSSRITYNKAKKTYNMTATNAPINMGIKLKGTAAYTTKVQNPGSNLSWAGAYVNGDMLSVCQAGTIKVTVSTKESSNHVYPAFSKSFTIQVTGLSPISKDSSKKWQIAQNADETLTIIKYLGKEKDVALPKSLKVGVSTPKEVTAIADGAFKGTSVVHLDFTTARINSIGAEICKDVTTLKTIRLAGSVKKMGPAAFEGCTSLEKVYFADGIKNLSVRLLKNCKSVKEIMLPVKAETVQNEAFRNCKGVEVLHIPASVKELGDNAFAGWGSMKKKRIYYGGSREQLVKLVSSSKGNDALLQADLRYYADYGTVPSQKEMTDEELFTSYASYLDNRSFFKATEEAVGKMSETWSMCSDMTGRIAFKAACKNGLDYVISALLTEEVLPEANRKELSRFSDSHWSKTEHDVNRQLAQELLQEMASIPDYKDLFEEEYKELANARTVYSKVMKPLKSKTGEILDSEESMEEFAGLLVSVFGQSDLKKLKEISEKDVLKVLKVLKDHWGTVKTVFKGVDHGLDVIDFMFIFFLYVDLSSETLHILMQKAPEDSGLYDGLVQIRAYVEAPVEEIIIRFLEKDVLNQVVKFAVDALLEALGDSSSLLNIATLVYKIVGYMIPGADINVLNKTGRSLNNIYTLKQDLDDLRREIIADMTSTTPAKTADEWNKQYKAVMSAYLVSIMQFQKYLCGTLADEETMQQELAEIKSLWARYEKTFTYRNYLNSCKYHALNTIQ